MREEATGVRIWRRQLDWSAMTLDAALSAESDVGAGRVPLLTWVEPRAAGGTRVDAMALLCRGWPGNMQFELDEARLFFSDGLVHAVSDRRRGLRAIELRFREPAAIAPDGASWEDLGEFEETVDKVYTRRDLRRFLGEAADKVDWRNRTLMMREFRRAGRLFTSVLLEGGNDGR